VHNGCVIIYDISPRGGIVFGLRERDREKYREKEREIQRERERDTDRKRQRETDGQRRNKERGNKMKGTLKEKQSKEEKMREKE
jgi:hypothetical protein